jgi:putative colanic acid biosynthesis acetyltransferase WcaF
MTANVNTPLRLPRLAPAPPPSLSNKLARLVWGLVQATLFRWSPTALHMWRRVLIRIFGGRIAPGAHIYADVKIWAPWNLTMARASCLGPRVICYNVAPFILEENALVSQGAHLCAASHDIRCPNFTLIVGPITIGADAWIAADAFVGPGVTVGARAVIGARSVLVKDAATGTVLAGNPARVVARR